MRSFPIWDNSQVDISILQCTLTPLCYLSPSEQRAPWVINQLASETQGAERDWSGFIYTQSDVGFQFWSGSLFPHRRPSICLCFGLFLQSLFIQCLSRMRQTDTGRKKLQGTECVCVCDRLTSGKLLMLTIMSWGDFMEIWPSWFRGNFPSWVVTTMWSRAPK